MCIEPDVALFGSVVGGWGMRDSVKRENARNHQPNPDALDCRPLLLVRLHVLSMTPVAHGGAAEPTCRVQVLTALKFRKSAVSNCKFKLTTGL